jgi:ferritin
MATLSKKMEDALNAQIQAELYSAYLYLAMSAHFEAANLEGFGRWTKLQAKEELEHGMKFFDYVNDRGGRAKLMAIQQPPVEFKSTSDIFKQILEHEQKVTGLIHDLYRLAVKEDDPATQIMLQWYITEQVEEEKAAGLIVEQLKLIEDRGTAILFLDKQLGKRGGS